MKKLLYIVVVLCLWTGLIAGGQEESAAQDGPVELRFTLWSGNADHLALLDSLVEPLKSEDISVKFETIPFNDYVTKLTLQLAGSNPPDAGWLLENSGPAFIESGAVAEVGEYLKGQTEYDYNDFSEPATSLWVRGEKVYGVPFSTSPFIIFYNKDMFAEAGLELPPALVDQGRWSWEEFAEYALEIKAATGNYALQTMNGAGYDSRIWHTWVPFIRAYGGTVWSDSGEPQFSSPEVIEATRLYHQMIFDDKTIVPPGDQQSDFFTGKAAMTISQISRVAKLSDADFEWGIVSLPTGPVGEVSVIGQAAKVVFSASRYPQQARRVLEVLTNENGVTALSEYFPPARESVLFSSSFLSNHPVLSENEMRYVAEGVLGGRTLPSHANFPKIDLITKGVMDNLWQPNADVEAVMNELDQKIAPLLK